MNTSYESVIESFLVRVERDREFFEYLNVEPRVSMDIAIERAKRYMYEAAARIALEGMPSVDFLDYDDEAQSFGFEMTKKEVFIMSSLMFESYMSRDISKLKCLSVNYTSTDLRVFDPSNARKTFQSMYELVRKENKELLDTYRNTNRLTGDYIGIDFSSYDEE